MIDWFNEAFQKNRVSFCLLKNGNEVYFQNPVCKTNCGDFTDGNCPQTCIHSCERWTGKPLEQEGFQFFANTKLGNRFFDVFFLSSYPFRMVLLYPLQRKFDSWIKRFKDKDLSNREQEIANLCLQGFTNSKILKSLSISKATLKTHLNNIYKKMPEARSESWRKHPVG